MGGLLDGLGGRWVDGLVGRWLVCFAEALGDKKRKRAFKNRQGKAKTGFLDVLGLSVAPQGGTWGAQGDISGAWGPPGGAPEGHWGSLGGPRGAPRGSPGAPGWVLGAALGGFRADRGEQPPKKWPPSNPITVFYQKWCQKGPPRDPFWQSKSIQNRIKILMRF